MQRRRGLIERLRGRRPAPSTSTARPTGTVTFVLTDIEGSTRLWETQPDAMERAIGRHGTIVAEAIEACGGTLIRERGEGDSTFSVFPHAPDAIAAALAVQRSLSHEPWEPGVELRVRIAMHTGDAYLISDDEYASPVINRCARIREVAYGGQVLVSEQTLDMAGGTLPDGASLLDLGPHRLRDLSRPVRIFQLLHPDLPQTFPKLRSLEAGLHNLPVQLTSFIGRDREVDEVRKHLASTRLLNLVGPGGIGKTRLALQAAGDAADAYPDGIWFVDLSAVTDGAQVPQAVADALSLREEHERRRTHGRSIADSVIDHLRSANALIALDNCEHLVDAASTFASALLRSCVEVSVIATTREPLRVPGASTWRVPAMTVPDDTVPTEAYGEFESIRLFTERAALVRPDFSLTHESAPVVARICEKLDGVPLAIELAAANVASMSVADIESRLDDRFRTLVRGGPDVPRHGTLQATVDWSHDLLNDRERVLFRRLSVFTGGFALEGAEDVCSDGPLVRSEIAELVSRLVDKSLVVLDDLLFTTRYTMLETIREYAAGKLDEAGERDGTEQRHADHFRAFVARIAGVLEGADEGEHTRAIEIELPNVRTALTRLTRSRPAAALSLAADLGHFWAVRGLQREGLASINDALDRSGPVDRDLESRARLAAGVLTRQGGDLDGARTLLERAVKLRRDDDDAIGLGEALTELGNVLHQSGDIDGSRTAYEEALAIARAAEDDRGRVAALNGLGIVALSTGDLRGGDAIYDEMIQVAKRIGYRRGLASALANRAVIAYEIDDLSSAEGLFTEALQIARELGDRRLAGMQLNGLGAVALGRGDGERARALHDEALELYRSQSDPLGEAETHHRLGELARATGDPAAAIDAFDAGRAIYRANGHTAGAAEAALGLGLAQRTSGDPASSASLLEALREFDTIGWTDGIVRCIEGLAGLIAGSGRSRREAAVLLASAAAARERLGTVPSPSDADVTKADVERARTVLGDGVFEAAWDDGTRLSLDDATRMTLDLFDQSPM